MKAWVVRDFAKPMSLESLKSPELSNPEQIIVEVKAAGVNPIDTMMCKGYGNAILSLKKKIEEKRTVSRLPFVGGREFSGVVVCCGGNVKRFKEGDQVMGVVGPTYMGSHAEYVLVKESWCCEKPSKISFVEAASVLYSACTAWSALISVARLNPNGCGNIRVLINGGSGSVGTIAIQMLKAWGASVVASTCSPKNRSLVQSLGAVPVDYTNEPAAKKQLSSIGPFDVILDCVESDLAEWSDNLLGVWRNSVHVSLISPVLRDTDRLVHFYINAIFVVFKSLHLRYGIVPGALSVAAKYFRRSALPAVRGRWFSYAYFAPHLMCLEAMKNFINNGKLKPVVERTYAFADLPAAYEKVSKKHGCGKTVIDFRYGFFRSIYHYLYGI
uniref:PKS_ER domain-containing protein n=1 Tax=Syphacia muris TaxID=451379 RepID=A0A158R5Z7_9BILA